MCTILGYGLPERETCCILSICGAFEFLHLYKRTFRFVPAILEDCTVSRIQPGFLSTANKVRGFYPFLSRKELRFASFPFLSFRILIFYKEKFLFTPAIPLDCTASRIQPGFLPTYEPWLIPTCESFLDSHRQQTKFAALLYAVVLK